MKHEPIRHRDALLQNIAAGLNALPSRTTLGAVQITLHTDSATFEFPLPYALDVLANDLYWDERGDWSQANRATVETI